jgi:hypothetical protein
LGGVDKDDQMLVGDFGELTFEFQPRLVVGK